MCENRIINTLKRISTHACTRRVVCWFVYSALYPPEEKKRRQLKELKGVGRAVVQEGEARGGRERRKEGWSHVEKTVLWQLSNEHA